MNLFHKVVRLVMFLCTCGLLANFGHAQGTVLFQNYVPPLGVNAPVYESDGVTPLSGAQFVAELLGGDSASNLESLATTGFLTGTGAGYSSGGSRAIPGVVPGGTAWIQVRVWNTGSGSSFTQAQASGMANSWWASAVFTLTPGGGTINPTTPAPLTGLGNSPVYLNSVPEPSPLGLIGLGIVAALFGYKTPQREQMSEGSHRVKPRLRS